MTIAIGDDVIDVLVHGPNRYFDNYRADPIPGVRDVYPFGYCAPIFLDAVDRLTALAKEVAVAKQLDSSIDIDAGPERVWEVLTDFGAYPEWNPFMAEQTLAPRRG
jgi:Polyketide cyclase / dehydrase and lipid transport